MVAASSTPLPSSTTAPWTRRRSRVVPEATLRKRMMRTGRYVVRWRRDEDAVSTLSGTTPANDINDMVLPGRTLMRE